MRLLILCLITTVISPPTAEADWIYGVKSFGNAQIASAPPARLFRFKPGDANPTDLGNITRGNQINVDALALSSAGLYGYELFGSDSNLVVIDPSTAEATLIGSALSGRQIRGATFDRLDRLWIVDSNSNQLIQIDSTNGAVVGAAVNIDIGVSDVIDIAVDTNGDFMLVDDQTFYGLDPLTGQTNELYYDSNTSVDGYHLENVGIAFDPTADGALFTVDIRVDDDVFRYDPNAGFARTLFYGDIFSEFNSGRGDMASSVSMIPEPGAIPLLGLLGGLCLLVRSRRRKTVENEYAAPSIVRAGKISAKCVVLIMVTLFTTTGSPAQGQTFDWINRADDNSYWHVGSNWSPTGPPGVTQNALFELDETYGVWWNNDTGDRAVARVIVTDGNVTFLNKDSSDGAARHTLTTTNLSVFSSLTVRGIELMSINTPTLENGGVLTIDGSHLAGSVLTIEADLNLESVTGGQLFVESGGVVSNVNARIGTTSESFGEVTVSGARSQWSNSGDLTIGGEFGSLDGRGRLTVNDQAVVSVAGETSIAGDGGLLLDGGELVTGSFERSGNDAFLQFDSGTLTIDGGAFLRGADSFTIDGPNLPAPTLVLRNGAGTTLANRLTVGNSDEGRLRIESGALVSTGLGLIARNDGSVGSATVTGAGSRWDTSSLFYVGESGNGTIHVEDGGVVANNGSSAAHIAFGSTSTGEATVQDAGSQWIINSDLNVGTSGVGSLNVQAGGVVSNTDGFLARNVDSVGSATIEGSGSEWNNTGNLFVGYEGSGEMLILSGGHVSNSLASYIGWEANTIGEATVRDTGSHWENAADMHVGYFGNGTLTLLGGLVTNENGHIGRTSDSIGVVNVVGSGSHWDNSGLLLVGEFGTGTLNIGTDGLVSSDYGIIGFQSTAVGSATVSGSNSKWNVANEMWVGESGNGTLNIEDQGMVTNSNGFIGMNQNSIGEVNVRGEFSTWSNSQDLNVGYSGNGTLNVSDQGQVFSENGFVGTDAIGTVNVQDSGSSWQNSENLYVGYSHQGALNISGGASVFSVYGEIGSDSTVKIRDDGSRWALSGELAVGSADNGTLTIELGGEVTSQEGVVNANGTAMGLVTVKNENSLWQNADQLIIGKNANGMLNVLDGGTVSTKHGLIASTSSGGTSAVGNVIVNGPNSLFENSSNLRIGLYGSGTLTLEDSGRVTVGGTTFIGDNGTVNLLGGRLEFGETSLGEFAAINAVSGSLAGNLNHVGYTDVGTLPALRQNSSVDMTGVRLTNSGTLFGHGSLGTSLINTSTGEIETVAGERMRFAGAANKNHGEINNFGGVVRFDQDLTNSDSGYISGRGQFIANGGWTNGGVMAFSGGSTDILGDLENIRDGQIVTSGNGTTTFYDDLLHNGLEIRTSAFSSTVFFGEVSGAGDFTGTGQVFFEGDLRPGNSPDIVSFEGDVIMGSSANLHVELAGLGAGDFDQLDIAGDLFLNGDLWVDMIGGFQLSADQEFIVADINGMLDGQFNGLDEGERVGNFGGMDLFVSYRAGDGNDVSLFTTPVPEPGSIFVCAFAMISLFSRRNRVV